MEAGIVLSGTEIKAIRAGKVNLADAGAAVRVPADVDGVPVVTEVVGAVHPL